MYIPHNYVTPWIKSDSLCIRSVLVSQKYWYHMLYKHTTLRWTTRTSLTVSMLERADCTYNWLVTVVVQYSLYQDKLELILASLASIKWLWRSISTVFLDRMQLQVTTIQGYHPHLNTPLFNFNHFVEKGTVRVRCLALKQGLKMDC